jgi:predicted site-specific integrase-resolvase
VPAENKRTRRRAPQRELLSPEEVAREFGVDARTVRRWRKDGLLKYHLLKSGAVRFDRRAIDDFIGPEIGGPE